MCLTSLCCRRGGKTSEGRDAISGRAEQPPGPAGWAGLCQHVKNTCLHPGVGAITAENAWLNRVGHSSPRAGDSRPPGYGYETLVPLPSRPALIMRAKNPSGIPGWTVDQPLDTGCPLPRQHWKQPMGSFLHEIFLWEPHFGEQQKQSFEGSTEFVSSLKLVTLDFDIIQQIGVFSGFLPVRKYLDIDFYLTSNGNYSKSCAFLSVLNFNLWMPSMALISLYVNHSNVIYCACHFLPIFT